MSNSKVTMNATSKTESMVKFPYPWTSVDLFIDKEYLENTFNSVAPAIQENFKKTYGHMLKGPKCMALVENYGVYREKLGQRIGTAILRRILEENHLQFEVNWPSLEIKSYDWFMV